MFQTNSDLTAIIGMFMIVIIRVPKLLTVADGCGFPKLSQIAYALFKWSLVKPRIGGNRGPHLNSKSI